MLGALILILLALPWLPPLKRAPVAVVDLANCNGCTRCANDCPYNAITMMPRTDGRAFEREAVVNASLCVSCGICAGACPTSMPFRRASALVPGIDLPGLTIAALRDRVHAASGSLTPGPRIMALRLRPRRRGRTGPRAAGRGGESLPASGSCRPRSSTTC